MSYKCFRFTIQGDDFNPDTIKEILNIPCESFKKEDVIIKHYMTERIIKQKTNRLIYFSESLKHERIDGFLTKNLLVIRANLSILKHYIKTYQCKMELVIYSNNDTNLHFNQKQIKLLHEIGMGINISFC